MNDEIKRIQNLLDKYMDGATSNEEEATLRKYFEEHGNDIPEEWESYRALFSYIGFEQMNLSQILKEEEKKEDFEKKDIAKENIEKKEEGEIPDREVVPAQGWVVNAQGEVMLVGYNPGNAADSRNPRPSSVCVPR